MSFDQRSIRPGLRQRASPRSRAGLTPVRRVVTGLDAAGRATVQSDGIPPHVYTRPGNGPTIYEIWNTRQRGATGASERNERQEDRLRLASSENETRMRVLDFLPEGPDRALPDGARLAEMPVGPGRGPIQPPFPASASIVYCIVLSGEMTMILDGAPTVVRTGDIVVQRGTQPDWVNTSGRLCRVAFILVGAAIDDDLSAQPG